MQVYGVVRLTKDPEIKIFGEVKVCNVSLAWNTVKKG